MPSKPLETDALASRFKKEGYEVVDSGEADIFVVNTCTVTNTSDQKCRQAIHQIRRKNPEALIVVTGCMVNHRKEELIQEGVADYVIDNERKAAIFDIVDEHFKKGHSDPEGYDRDLFSYQPAYDLKFKPEDFMESVSFDRFVIENAFI